MQASLRVLRGACLCIGAVSSLSAVAAPSIYNAVRIGALGGSASFGVALNNAGEAAGWSWTSGITVPHAWRATGTQTTDLGQKVRDVLAGSGHKFSVSLRRATHSLCGIELRLLFKPSKLESGHAAILRAMGANRPSRRA